MKLGDVVGMVNMKLGDVVGMVKMVSFGDGVKMSLGEVV